MPGYHALLSASTAERWLHCTPSARMGEAYPDKTSEYAKAGTLAHAIAELKLQKYITPMSMKQFNALLKPLKSDPLFEPAMMTSTDVYLDHIKALVTRSPPRSRPDVFAERRVDYGHIAPEGFGTADCIVIGNGELHVVDYKNGAGVRVSAEDNPQLKLYGLGAMWEFALLHHIERVGLHIVQPNADGISSWETTAAELEAWGEQVRPIAQAAYDGVGECQSGEWCRWCRARVDCPAQRRGFQVFEDLTQKQTEPDTLTEAAIGDLLTRMPAVINWMDSLRDHALAQILSGSHIPGWKTVEGVSRRAWSDQGAAFKALTQSGIDEAILYERKPLTLAAIEKAVGKKSFEPAAPYVSKPQGAPTLAPITDKRPVFTGSTPEHVFQIVEEIVL